MGIRFITKKCPNCGANFKFNINDTSVTCEYCGTYALIEHEKQNMYTPPADPNVKKVYVNKAGEICKWLSRALIAIVLVIIGFAVCTFSPPVFGVLLIVAGILTILPISFRWLEKIPHLKTVIIATTIFVGFFGGAFNSYKLPKEFQGKYISDSSDITVEIKGNTIIVNDNGKITKEKIDTWEQTWGNFTYHNIKVNGGKYEFRIVNHKDREYQFYQKSKTGSPEAYFYNTKNKDKYVLGEF